MPPVPPPPQPVPEAIVPLEGDRRTARRPRVEAEHVDVGTAHIDVSSAEIVQSSQSRLQARYLAYALIVLFIFVIAIGLANLLFTSSQVHDLRATQAQSDQNSAALRKQILADCASDRDLAGLPLANAPNGHPSELGVKIISDFRGAFTGHNCPGTLPPPDPTFVAGAKYYRIPVN